jgi:hypothetical protein
LTYQSSRGAIWLREHRTWPMIPTCEVRVLIEVDVLLPQYSRFVHALPLPEQTDTTDLVQP